MILLAKVTDPASIAHYLAAVGEATEGTAPLPEPSLPCWKSRVLRRLALVEDHHLHVERPGEFQRHLRRVIQSAAGR